MRELKFSDPVFKNGLNMTVRRGTRWDIGKNQPILIANGNQQHSKPGTVKWTLTKRFKDITARDLEQHHSAIQTWPHLYDSMRSIYQEFTSDEICTLVYFEFATQ